MKPIDLDATTESSDWTKTTWDLPPYGSPEFFEAMPDDYDDAVFRRTPAYLAAEAEGLIKDGEWVADWTKPAQTNN